jgi:hypothetical protein
VGQTSGGQTSVGRSMLMVDGFMIDMINASIRLGGCPVPPIGTVLRLRCGRQVTYDGVSWATGPNGEALYLVSGGVSWGWFGLSAVVAVCSVPAGSPPFEEWGMGARSIGTMDDKNVL